MDVRAAKRYGDSSAIQSAFLASSSYQHLKGTEGVLAAA